MPNALVPISQRVGAQDSSVAASQTNAVVSKPFPVTAGGSQHARIDIYTGKVVVAAAVSAAIQDSSGYNIWTTKKSVSITASTQKTFTADSSTDQLTAAGHGLVEDQPFILTVVGVLPAPLQPSVVYYALVVSANVIQVKASPGASPIDLTSAGSGANTLTAVGLFSIPLLDEVAGDQTYLPLRSMARIVATTGAGDSLEIVDIIRQIED